MSVGIPPAPSVAGTLPQVVIASNGRLESTGSTASLDTGKLLKGLGIGAGVGAAVGGATLLGKFALPFIGSATSAMGVLKFAGIGAGVGAAAIAAPFIWKATEDKPAARSVLVGAGVGAIAGAILPIIPTWLGAIAGAAAGLAIHATRRNDGVDVPHVNGYATSSGWAPVARLPIGYGAGVPGGIPVPPNVPGGIPAMPVLPGGPSVPAPPTTDAGAGQLPPAPPTTEIAS